VPAILADELLVFEQLVLELPLERMATFAGLRQTVDGVHHEMKTVWFVKHVMLNAVVIVPFSL
jgi:hypothetical protein